jgi:hypothetical protein
MRRHDSVCRTEERRKPEVDEIDAGNPERHVTGQRDALVQEPVQEIEDRAVRVVEDLIGGASRHRFLSPE